MNLVFLGNVGIIFLLFAPYVVGLFGGDQQTVGYAIRCLRIVSAGFFCCAYGMVLTSAFNGAGATWTPTLLNLGCFWLLEIPLAWVLARPLGLGTRGCVHRCRAGLLGTGRRLGHCVRRGRRKTATV